MAVCTEGEEVGGEITLTYWGHCVVIGSVLH